MANDLDKLRSQFENLEKRPLKEFSLANVQKHFKHFEDCYATCLKLEAELLETLPGARDRGVTGSDDKAFLRDPIFKKKYKEYNSAVDVIDKAEKEAFVHTTMTGSLVADLENLKRAIDKAYPKSKDMAVQLLHKLIDKRIAEMEKASDIYDVRGKHKKMREYSSKFQKKIDAIIDQAPPSDKPEELDLPKELEPKELDKAEKTAQAMLASIEKASKNIGDLIKKIEPFTRDADTAAKKEEAAIDANLAKLRSFVKRYTTLITKSLPKKAKGDNDALIDIDKFKVSLEKILKDADAIDKKTTDALDKPRGTLK